ncbi:PucR family transcriptional regulator [Kitasatospora cineracea]|uniref:CdaR family transcriptional regulator n=1 Tax=Kitasatospora cineracea TaxID=88074 RepID=A0A3N4RMW4_9ACTN|nr:helix-turn-helix domain-containing protein [Kitasatospora cineracea]ROR38391.1 CdaR family transcriptional regulator [Kitasatospora cineracea]RPE32115.1 CdaR family transcriptional regulator [Kitasatospora cineracea]
MTGLPLRQLLMSLGEPLVELQAAPAGLDVPVRHVAILDPEDPPTSAPGELVLAIGARGRAALPALRAAGRARAAAVAVKLDGPGQADALREAATEAGVALLSVRRETRWEHLDSLARTLLSGTDGPDGPDPGGPATGDLFSLAQTVAVLTGGIVSIEDTSSRVLAYSRTSETDEVDDLRRLSILGRQGPEPYLAKLREWGVFSHLRGSEGAIEIAAHPELGIRRRLAISIRSGAQPLGTIWVQEGSRPLTDTAEQALVGAARVAAGQLVRRRRELSADTRLTQTLLTGLLEGSTGPQSLATHLGLDVRRPATVLAYAPAATDDRDAELTRDEVTGLISVHTAARHRGALLAPVDSRVYVLLPELPPGVPLGTLRDWTQETVDAARDHLSIPLRAAIGPTVPGLADVPASRAQADRILDAMGRGGVVPDVAALQDVQAEVLVSEVLALLQDRPELRDPRLTALTAYDTRHHTRLAESVLAYLDALGEVRTAADALHIHPNTLRYRVRRAEQLTGLDLAQPRQRLLAMLQLRLHEQ